MASKDPNSKDYKTYKNHLMLMYLNILLPVIVVSIYIEPLFETLVVPSIISKQTWGVFRIITVILAISFRMFVFREEI
jgi:hypothetical protein